MENETFNVGTLFHCDRIFEYEEAQTFDPLWTQTVKGCNILQLLQDMYRFNVTYIIQKSDSNNSTGSPKVLYPEFDDNVDIYTRPMSLRSELTEFSYPIQEIYKWKLGFILRRPENKKYFQTFYSKPFTRPVWTCLYGMAIMISIMFYILQIWEKNVIGEVQENGITYEMLLMIGSYCQHIPPLHAMLSSRRAAYFVFLSFSYVIYSFYTSNLLSYLVNDKNEVMTIATLLKSNYNYVVTESAKLLMEYKSTSINNRSMMNDTHFKFKPVSIPFGLNRVKEGNTALLSDFTSLDPYMKMTFEPEELCKLIRVDLFSNINKYFFASKHFNYKEQIKIGTQRAKEVGILKRLIDIDFRTIDVCEPTKNFQTTIVQIFTPLVFLIGAYVLSIVIVVGERYHYQRYRLFPYFD